ncbi:phenylalanine--tRNA ligase beta subunit-related protein [Bacillus sp. DTU_2020_1000418_1_SI_GHA_SEK_038]|uniref:B3/B4 domain-containing protein n=1 Tax=Bacillus sp. DTU_2020_1000418_1_SI_GHA_SEK_038 TaxID=3077585 RepID=UPI0028E632F9|nr:phenylalanine--tRNA ligase beta subunit-related protein [Bacillus sp. DTU_2020_1000418_1_SI_GHA_SEK_038]WNS76679.1 phenylalanine--tRNA ligase beta subunit-related protein [Bacillus sp. DTU_2020_1000418_1_SI_GHA_SEK_038]
MEIHVSSELCELIPDIKIGVIRYQNIEVGESPQMVKGRLQLFQESIYFELEDKNVTDLDGIKEWRQIFKAVGKDPNRYRHSAEALYRRVKKQNYLQPVNSATDINNFFSLHYQVPIGVYDMDKLNGNVTMRLGKEGEEYVGLNGRPNSLHRLIVTCDDIGAFGSPFVDSERSAITEKTKNAIHIVYLRPSLNKEEANKMVTSLMNMFIQIHGGQGIVNIIGC